jgi:hypothetical protein
MWMRGISIRGKDGVSLRPNPSSSLRKKVSFHLSSLLRTTVTRMRKAAPMAPENGGNKMESRKFQVQSIGMVKGGQFEYTYDDKLQILQYKINVVTSLLGNERNNSAEGSQAIAKEALKSSNYNRPGAPVHFAGLVGEVTSVYNGVATANLKMTVGSTQAEGIGTFDVTGEYVNLASLNARVKFLFLTAQVVALPMQAGVGTMASKSHTKV